MPLRTSTVVATSLTLLAVGGVFSVFGDSLRASFSPPETEVTAQNVAPAASRQPGGTKSSSHGTKGAAPPPASADAGAK